MSRKFLITGLTSAAIVATMGLAYAQSQDESALANSNVNGTQNSLGHDQAGPPAMPADAAAMSATYGSSYDEQGRLAASGDTSSAVSAPAGGDMNTDNSAATSANMGATTSDTANNPYSASTSTSTDAATDAATMGTGSAVSSGQASGGSPSGTTVDMMTLNNAPADGSASSSASPSASPSGTTSSSATTAETRVDLNSPNERQYNIHSDPVGNNFREGQSSSGSTSNWNGSDNSTAPAGEMRAPRADRN